MKRAKRVSAAVVGLLAVALVGGCESSEEPASSGSPTPSASPTSAPPSPSPSPTLSETETEGPDIPAAARKQTPEGAEAFVRFFLSQVNEAWTVPRVGIIKTLSSEKCQFCEKTEKTAGTLDDRGDRYSGEPLSVKGTEVITGAPNGQAYIFVDLVQNRTNILDSDGEVVHSNNRKSLPSNVVLIWEEGRWAMLELEEA